MEEGCKNHCGGEKPRGKACQQDVRGTEVLSDSVLLHPWRREVCQHKQGRTEIIASTYTRISYIAHCLLVLLCLYYLATTKQLQIRRKCKQPRIPTERHGVVTQVASVTNVVFAARLCLNCDCHVLYVCGYNSRL